MIPDSITRDETIRRIRAALQARSGKRWSVKGGRGTTWGWIEIDAPPARKRVEYEMSDRDRAELAGLLGLPEVFQQGVNVPAGRDYWQEYIDRAEGRTPSVRGERYWD